MPSPNLYTMPAMERAKVKAVTSTATGFVKESLLDFNPDTYWSPSSTADQTIDIDLGVAYTIDQFAVWIHNYNTDYDFGTHAIQVSSDDNDDGNYTGTTVFAGAYWDPTVGDPIYFPAIDPTPASKRYWRVVIGNCGSNIAQISGLFFLRKRSITAADVWPETDAHRYYSSLTEGPGGRQFISEVNRNKSIVITRNYILSGTTDMTALQNAFDDSRGRLLPLILNEDSTNYFVRFDQDELVPNQIEYQLYQPTVTFRQIAYAADGSAY